MSYASHNIIRNTARKLSATLPADYTTAVDQQDKIAARAEEFTNRGANADRLVADALAAGKDPSATKTSATPYSPASPPSASTTTSTTPATASPPPPSSTTPTQSSPPSPKHYKTTHRP